MSMNRSFISHEECEEIISKLTKLDKTKVNVEKYEIKNYSEGYPGFQGDYFSLKITYCSHACVDVNEAFFFVKSMPVDNVEKRETIKRYGTFKKETDFFKSLFPNLLRYTGEVKWYPKCYLVRDDLLVFEDLKLSSYGTLPKHIEPTINHIKVALRSLATFHTSGIIYERLELQQEGRTIGDAYKDVMFETSYASDNPWCMTGIRALKAVALHKTKYGFGSNYERDIENKFIEKVCTLFELLESNNDYGIPRVCCHRDLWRNNLMYQFDNNDFNKPTSCILIDFQICHYLPLTADVIMCIVLPSQDHSIVNECLKFYYEQLSHELMKHQLKVDDIMSWDDFEVSCKRFMLFPLVQQAMFSELTHLPEEYLTNLLTTDEKKYTYIMLENRDETVLHFMETDEFYRTTMIRTVERLIEHLFVDR